MPRTALGLDFGTESVRALLVDVATGGVLGRGSVDYAHGVIDRTLPGSSTPLPHDYALQHPQDWLDGAAAATGQALAAAKLTADDVVGVGVDFTSCTMLPTTRDGTPLCLLERFRNVPLAWPKLWKHHGAKEETDRFNEVARRRNEAFLARYGGSIGLEWFFPKMLETARHAPEVYAAADVYVEAGDWFVWQLVGGDAATLPRSTCQAGYKACWSADRVNEPNRGYPSREFLHAVDPRIADVVNSKMPGTPLAPGRRAGGLTKAMATRFGLREGTPVGAAIIDAHAGVPGAGAAEVGTLVMVLGTSSCHMLNGDADVLVPGIAGIVPDGILPGSVGYETGQASVGDAFAAVSRLVQLSHAELNARAARLPPGSNGVLAIDWLNGCRTPLMDGRLSGAFVGVTLTTAPEQLYRATIEGTAFGVKWIVETLTSGGVPVKKLVAAGGLPKKSPLLMQVYADVLNAPITTTASDEPVALGAAILGACAAETATPDAALLSRLIHTMAPQRDVTTYTPDAKAAATYAKLYQQYRTLTDPAGPLAGAMRTLRGV
jgi:L-ribulokinase